MPIVTNGLQVYINSKDGIKSPRKFTNLAPGGAAIDAVITGGTYNAADGSLTLDGIDDYVDLMLDPNGAVMRAAGSWTYEYIFHMLAFKNDGAYHELSGNAHYMDIDPNLGSGGGVYTDFYSTSATSGTHSSFVYPNHNQNIRQHFQFRYDSATNVVSFYANGVLVENKTYASTPKLSLAKATGNAIGYNRGYDSTPFNLKFQAVRFYNRALSNAELTQNYNNGIEIGLSEPEVKIATLRIKNPAAGSFTDIPVYAIAGHTSEKVRVQTPAGLGYIPIVATTDPLASRVRIRVGTTTMALRK